MLNVKFAALSVDKALLPLLTKTTVHVQIAT